MNGRDWMKQQTLTWDALSGVINLLRLREAIDRFERERVTDRDTLAIFLPADLAPELERLWGIKVIHHKYLPDNSVYLARIIPDIVASNEPAT